MSKTIQCVQFDHKNKEHLQGFIAEFTKYWNNKKSESEFINNFYSCISEIATESWSEEVQLIVNYVPFIIFIILGLIGCAVLSRKTVYFKKRLYRPKSLISQGRSFVTFFFTSPCIILFSAYHILQACLLLLPQAANFI